MNKKKIYIISILLVLICIALFYFLNKKDISIYEQKPYEVSESVEIVESKKIPELYVCGKLFFAESLYIDNIDITKRIAQLIDREYLLSTDKESTFCSILIEYYPSNTVLDTQLIQLESLTEYRFYLEAEFAIDTKSNLIYNINALDGSTGDVLGTFK